MNRKFWAATTFVLTTMLYAAGPVLLVMAGQTGGITEFVIPATYAFSIVGFLIATHRPDNAVARICLMIGLAFGLETTLWSAYAYGVARPGVVAIPEIWAVAGSAFLLPGIFLIFTLLLLVFPDGQVPSPRWRWFARITVGLIAGLVVFGFFLPTAGDTWTRPAVPNPIGVAGADDVQQLVMLLVFACVVVSVVALARRFRRSTGIERLQLRWLATAGGIAVVVWAVAIGLGGEAAVATASLGMVLIPVAIGVAVLRYRLFEIDRLVSRTVEYGLVIAVLGAILAAIAIGLPRLVGVPEENPVLVAGATLAVAALFNPLRRRVQAMVDRRFNRARYDAQQEVDRFAERLRDELDIEDLTDEVLAVVNNTMRPTTASVWLKKATR